MANRLSIGDAWVEAAAFIRRERRVLAPVVLGLLMVPAVITSMVQPQAAAGQAPAGGGWMVIALLALASICVGMMAIVLLSSQWRASVGAAIGRSARRLPVLAGAGLLVFIPLMVIASFVLAGAGMRTSASGMLDTSAVGSGGRLALTLLFIATLMMMARLLPLIAVVASSEGGPIAALRQSFRLTRGKAFKLVSFVLLMMVAFVISALATAAVVGSLVTLMLGQPDPWTVSLLIMALAMAMLQSAFLTIFSAMLARITLQLNDASSSGT